MFNNSSETTWQEVSEHCTMYVCFIAYVMLTGLMGVFVCFVCRFFVGKSPKRFLRMS